MPTNRKKRTRARDALDSQKLYELFYGPGTCLFAGCGYAGPTQKALGGYTPWSDIDADARAAILETMHADWRLLHRQVLKAWRERDEHEVETGRRYYGDASKPWAQREFGDTGL